MKKVWIVVCNAARCRIFESNGAGAEWMLVDTFQHPEGRSNTSELVTDSAGQGASLGGSVHHDAKAPKTSPKEVEVARFIHTVVGALDRGLRSNHFSHLVLVAAPHVLGMLKNELTTELSKHLMSTVDKDLENMGAIALAAKLRVETSIPLSERDVTRAPEKRAH